MKQRIFPFIAAGTVVGLATVSLATLMQTGGTSLAGWLHAHGTTPALWMVDALSVLLAMSFVSIGALRIGLGHQRSEVQRIREDHGNQLNVLIARSEELAYDNTALDTQCVEQTERIAAMEEEIRSRQGEFDTETRRLTERVLVAVRETTEANARQLEAVNMALRYQRSELRQMRHGLNDLSAASDPAHIARLSPAELAAISGAITPGEYIAEDEEGDLPPLDMTVNGAGTVVMDTLEFDIAPALAIVHSSYLDSSDTSMSGTATSEEYTEQSDQARNAIG